MRYKYNDFVKKIGYSGEGTNGLFDSPNFKKAENDSFSSFYKPSINEKGIPSTLSADRGENPFLPPAEISSEDKEIENLIKNNLLKEEEEITLYTVMRAKEAGVEGINDETTRKLLLAYSKKKQIEDRIDKEYESKPSHQAVSNRPLYSKLYETFLKPSFYETNSEHKQIRKEIEDLTRPVLKYQDKLNDTLKGDYFEANPEMNKIVNKLGNGLFRFAATTYNISKSAKNLLLPLLPGGMLLAIASQLSGVKKVEDELQLQLQTAKTLVKNEDYIGYALKKDKTLFTDFLQGNYYGGSDLLTLGIDDIITNLKAAELRNKSPESYTYSEKEFLKAFSLNKEVEAMNIMKDSWAFTLGQGLASNIGYMIPIGASAKTVAKVGAATAKFAAVNSGRTTRGFWGKALKALQTTATKTVETAVGTLMQPMTYDAALRKYTENIQVSKDKEGNDIFLVDEKTRASYLREAGRDKIILRNQISELSNNLESNFYLTEDEKENLRQKIEEKESLINIINDTINKISVNGEIIEDSSMSRSLAYGLMQSGREYFTETIGGNLISRAGRAVMRTSPLRWINTGSKTVNARINNWLTGARKGKGIGKLFESASRHTGIGKVWHGVPIEWGEEVLNQFIPVMDESWIENVKQLGTLNFHRDVLLQTVLMGGIFGIGSKISERINLRSLSKEDREKYIEALLKRKNYSKDFKLGMQGLLLDVNNAIKNKEEADIINMATSKAFFNEKDIIEKISSLRAQGLEKEANYLESKGILKLGIEAFEQGRLESYLTILRKSKKSYQGSSSSVEKVNRINKTISSLEQLQRTASKYQDKINFEEIIDSASRKYGAETTLDEINSQIEELISKNSQKFKSYQESLSEDNPLKLIDISSLSLNNKDSQNLLEVLSVNQIGDSNRLLTLKLLQEGVIEDLKQANEDFNYETNPYYYKEILERTETKRLRDRVLKPKSKNEVAKIREDLKNDDKLTPEINNILTTQESGSQLTEEEIKKVEVTSVVETAKAQAASSIGNVTIVEDFDPFGFDKENFIDFKDESLMSMKVEDEEKQKEIKNKISRSIKIHAAVVKREAMKNPLVHEKDFDFRNFMLDLYNNQYKNTPEVLIQNFDLFIEAWKEAGINQQSEGSYELVFEELLNESLGETLIIDSEKFQVENKQFVKEEIPQVTIQEQNEELSKEITEEEIEIFKDSREVRRALKIPFLGQFYTSIVDKIQGIITKQDTNILNEEAFFFLNYKNLPVGKKVKIQLSEDWMNPDKLVSNWDTVTAENGVLMSERNDITMREFIEDLFKNRYKFEEVVKDEKLIKELFNNELFISKVPIDLIVDEQRLIDRGLHDIYWWNYDTVPSKEGERISEAISLAKAKGKILNEEDIELIRTETRLEQEAKINAAREKILILRRSLLKKENKTMGMIVSKREVGHILQNPIKIRNNAEVIVKDEKGKNIVLREVKPLEEANPTTIIALYKEGRFESKRGNEVFYIPPEQIDNLSTIQEQMTGNYKSSFGEGSIVMIFQVGTQEILNKDINKREVVPQYRASLVYSDTIEAQPYLNELLNTLLIIQKAIKNDSLFAEGIAENLIEDLNKRYNINLRDSRQRSEFIDLFPETVRKPIKEASQDKRGEPVKALMKDGILVEKGTPGAYEVENRNLLRYDLKPKRNRSSKIPNIEFTRDGNNKIISYKIKEELTYEEALKRGLYTTNNFLKIQEENGEVIYVADSQPIIILSPIEEIEDTIIESPKIEIKDGSVEQFKSWVEKFNKKSLDQTILEEEKEKVSDSHKGFIVNNLVQEIFIDLKTNIDKPFKLSEIYNQINITFNRVLNDLEKVSLEKTQALKEYREEILGYTQYEDSVREQIDLFFGKSQEYSDRILNKLEQEEEDLGEQKQEEYKSSEEVQEDEKEEIESLKKEHSKHSFEQNLSLSLRARTNLLLSGIEDPHESSFTFGNMKNYYSLGHVISGLQEAFNIAEDNSLEGLSKAIDHLINTTGKEESDYKFLNEIYRIFTNPKTPVELVKEIQFLLYQSQVKMIMAYVESNKNSLSLIAMDANNKNKDILRRRIWDNNFKQNFKLINNKGYTYSINKDEANKLIDTYTKWKENNSFIPTKEELKEFLLSFGINLHSKTIDDLLSGNKTLSYQRLMSSSGVIGIIINNLKTLKEKDSLDFGAAKNKEHVIFGNNNSNIKNLLAFDNRNIFIPASSVYIAGKTVNKYEQPCFITEQLKKLSGLDKETIENLLTCPFSKESFLLKYLISTQGNDASIEAVTVSLEALKVKGDKSSNKMGITDLSSKDYDVTTIGLFAHQGPKVEGRFGTSFNFRTTYLPFPPISDSSRLPLLKTIAVDLNRSNFSIVEGTDKIIPSTDILDLLYNQLVIPEFNRISEFIRVGQETGKAGYDFGANKFSMLPSLNGLLIGEKTLLQVLHEDLRNTEETQEIILTRYKDNIIEEIKEVLENVAGQYAKYNVETKNIEGSFLKDGIYDITGKTTTIENIDSSYIKSKEGENVVRSIQIIAYDYVVNYMLNQAQIQMLLSGDMANYYDDKKRNIFSDTDGTIFKTDTKEFMLEMAKLHFLNDKKYLDLITLIHTYYSLENEENKQEIYNRIKEDYTIEDGYNPILYPTLKDHNTVAKKLYRNFIRENVSTNYFKRLKGILSPGSKLANSKGRKTRQLCIKDVKISTAILKDLIDTYYPGEYEKIEQDIIEFKHLDDLGEKGDKQERYEELYKKFKKRFPLIQDYLSITSTDAQELTTWREFLEEIRDKGKITSQQYESIKGKLIKQSEEGYVPIEEYELTQDEMKIVFQPSKPLHAGLYYENHSGHMMQSFVYIKSSAFPLLPSMTRNFPHLENLRKNMEKIERIDGNNVRLSYQSANKVGGIRKAKAITSLYKKNLNEAEIQGLLESSLLLDKDNYSIQQEKPSDFNEQIEQNKPVLDIRGTQFEKILLSNGLNKIKEKIFPNFFDEKILRESSVDIENNLSGEDLYKILTNLYKKEQTSLKRQLFRSLKVKDITSFSKGNIDLYESVAEKIKSQLSNYQDKEGLELIYYVEENNTYVGYTRDEIKAYELKPAFADFKFPMWMLPNSRKFESILNSIINKNNVNLKIPGFHTIVGSQEGFDKMKEDDFIKTYGDLNKMEGMYFNPNYNGKLKATRDENGKLMGSQVLITNKFSYVKDGKRYKVDLKEYLKKDEQGNPTNQLDLERLPKEILTHFSFRIPTSAHQSGCLIEIAGFLPENYGDLMIVPSDYTVQMGEDYDIDARYVYGLHLAETETNGVKNLIKISYEYMRTLSLTEEEFDEMEILVLQNNISSLYKSVYSTTSKEILGKIREKLSTDTVRDTAEIIYEETKKDNFDSIYSPSYQKEMLKSGATGKLGIAIHSNFLTLTGLFQQMNHKVRLTDTEYNKEGEKIPIPFKMIFGENFISLGSLQEEKSIGEDRSISSYHMENQNTSTDNQKLLYMFKRNENTHTINILALMTMLGLNKDNGTIDSKSLSYPSLFISQPIIKRYCELMDYYTSSTTETFERPEDLTEEDLIKEFGEGLSWQETKYGPKIGSLDPIIKAQKEKQMTSENLFNNLAKVKDAELQWAVYEHFKKLKGKIKYLSAVQKFLNIENKGMGISYFNTIALKDFLSGELDEDGETANIETIDYFHIQGVKDMIGDFKRVPKGEEKNIGEDYIYISSNSKTSLFIKPLTYFGHKIVNSISMGYNMWKNLLPYESPYINNIINTIGDIAGTIEGTEKDLELKYTIINELKNFSYTSNSSLFTDDIEKVRRDLFIDSESNISLAGYLNYLQKVGHPLMRQPFFKQLEMRVGGINLPSVIIYNATSISKFEKNEIRKVFKNILDNKEALPTDEKGKTYTFESLGKALLQYAMLADQENGAVGFRHMFPMSFFDKYYVTSSVKAIGSPNNTSYHNIFFNGPVKSLELLLGSKIKDGFIKNIANRQFSTIEGYIERINKMTGKEIASFEDNGVRILEGETDFIHSRFTSQFMQHNPQYSYKITKNFVNNIKKVYKVSTVEDINGFNIADAGIDIDSDFVHIKEKKKIYLFRYSGGGNYERIPLLGLFGVNEYNYKAPEISTSIISENNLSEKEVKRQTVVVKTNQPILNTTRVFTIDTLLDTIIKNNSKYGGLAKAFSQFADKTVKIEVVKDLELNGIKTYGTYNSNTNTIEIDKDLVDKDPDLRGDEIRHILEEYVHSLTKNQLNKYITFNTEIVNGKVNLSTSIHENAPSSIIRLARIYQEAFKELLKEKNGDQFIIDFYNKRKALKDGDKELKTTISDLEAYRISDINEFIAGIFFDDNFRRLVGNKPYLSSGQNILQAWAETLIKFLQQIYSTFQENTVGRETINTLYEFLTEINNKSKETFTHIEEPDLFKVPQEAIERTKEIRDFLDIIGSEVTLENAKGPIYEESISFSNETNSIYNSLGDKTKSENVVVTKKPWNSGISEAIVAMRSNTGLYGNPFSTERDTKFKDLIIVSTTKDAVMGFIEWLTTDKYSNIWSKKREALLKQLRSGKLKDKPIVYYKELKEPSHATALDYLINKYDWKENKEDSILMSPKIETKEDVPKLFDSNPDLANAVYSAMGLNTIKESEITYTDEEGNPCAKMGLTNTVKGTDWKIVKDFKGKPKHSNGGVDITISDKGVTMRRGGKDIKAKYGLLIINNN